MCKFGEYPKMEKRIIKNYIDDLRKRANQTQKYASGFDPKVIGEHYLGYSKGNVETLRTVAKELTKILNGRNVF